MNFLVDKKTIWEFRSHTEQRSTQGKLILSIDLPGLEIGFFGQLNDVVFANQNTLYAFIILKNSSRKGSMQARRVLIYRICTKIFPNWQNR